MRDIWDSVEELLRNDTSLGWLDMQSYYLEVARS